MQREPDLAGEFGEHAVVFFGEVGASAGRSQTMRPSSSPLCAMGATRVVAVRGATSPGSQMSSQVPPDTPARLTTARSLSPTVYGLSWRCGTIAATS